MSAQGVAAALPSIARAYIVAMLALAAVSLGWLAQRPLTIAPVGVFLLLGILAVVLESRPLSFAHKGAAVDFSLGTPFVLAVLAVFGVLPAVLAQLAASVVGDLSSRKSAVKVILNASLSVVAVTAAGGVLELLLGHRVAYPGMGPDPRDLAAVLAAAAMFKLCNNLLTCVMIALATGTPLRTAPTRAFTQEALIEASSLLLVPPVVVTAQRHPIAVCFLLAPLAALYRALRVAMDNVSLANERTRALEDRQAAERRFRSMIQHSSDLICLVDQTGLVTYTSASIERVTGYRADGVVWCLFDRIHPDDRAVLRETLAHGATSTPVALPELRLLHADGSLRWVEIVVSDMPTDGPVLGMVLNIRDTTDRRRLEGQLRRTQKLDALGRLASGIAHDFKNLLSAVRGFAQLAREAGPTGEDYRDDLDEVLKATDRGATLIANLLAFARNEATTAALVDVNAAVEDISALLQLSLTRSVEFRFRPGCSLPRVEIDPGALEQVLVNLAVNARDAMGGTGIFEIATTTVSDSRKPQGTDWVRLRVSDSGSGIDEATLERMFEPFFTSKEGDGGTGLGLATIHTIVEGAGGRIDVDSSPGAGTIFAIDLPAVVPVNAAISTPSPEPDET